MRKPLLGLLGVGLVSLVLLPRPAGAWMHAGRWGEASGGGGAWDAEGWHGGSASGDDGSWHARGAWGGSASGGDGSWSGHGADGGYASGGDGSWHATGANGGTAYGGYDHYYGGSYTAYHPPTTVNYYGSGCYDCGGWNTAGAAAAGAAVGVVAGAAIGSANANAAASNAYAAGVAAGSAYPVGAIYATLPAGCTYDPQGVSCQ